MTMYLDVSKKVGDESAVKSAEMVIEEMKESLALRDKQFLELRSSYVRQVEEIEKLKCKLDAEGDREYQWRKEGKPLFTFGQELIFADTHKFKVKFINKRDTGEYFYSENGDDFFNEDVLSSEPLQAR